MLQSVRKERPRKYRGARPGPGREISDAANEALVARRNARGDRLELPAGSWGQARRKGKVGGGEEEGGMCKFVHLYTAPCTSEQICTDWCSCVQMCHIMDSAAP